MKLNIEFLFKLQTGDLFVWLWTDNISANCLFREWDEWISIWCYPSYWLGKWIVYILLNNIIFALGSVVSFTTKMCNHKSHKKNTYINVVHIVMPSSLHTWKSRRSFYLSTNTALKIFTFEQWGGFWEKCPMRRTIFFRIQLGA